MIELVKITAAAKRIMVEPDSYAALCEYEMCVKPATVLELVGLIRKQEAALSQAIAEAHGIPMQTGMVSVTAAELSCVINWLEGGRDPKDAAKELRLYCEREWTGAQPVARLPKWIDDQKGSDPNTDALIEYIEQLRAAHPVQQPAPVADEQAAFETWAFPQFKAGFDEKGFYSNSLTWTAWCAWRASSRLAAPVPAASVQPDEDDEADRHWRRLALQFDGHRMAALSHLRCLMQDAEKHRPVVEAFLSAPPLSGESVLAQRIAEVAASQPDRGRDAEMAKLVRYGFDGTLGGDFGECDKGPYWMVADVERALAAHPANVAQVGELSDAGIPASDQVVETNVALMRQRSAVGVKKYGTTLADSGLPVRALLVHALEESLDMANYIQAVIQQTDILAAAKKGD